MTAIEICCTAALGGHVERCRDCAHTCIAYNSCRNRHCPKCQWWTAAAWLAAREGELRPVRYFQSCSRCQPRSTRWPTRTRPRSTDCCLTLRPRLSPPLPRIAKTSVPRIVLHTWAKTSSIIHMRTASCRGGFHRIRHMASWPTAIWIVTADSHNAPLARLSKPVMSLTLPPAWLSLDYRCCPSFFSNWEGPPAAHQASTSLRLKRRALRLNRTLFGAMRRFTNSLNCCSE